MRLRHHLLGGSAAALLALVSARPAHGAGAEERKREIELQQRSASDLERLDELKAATAELALLHSWLDEAWAFAAKEEDDKTREVLDRGNAQTELIRQLIAASKLNAQAQSREAALNQSKDKLAKTKQALEQAFIKKKALEMNQK